MQFLKQENPNKRLYLQLKGFLEDTYLAIVGDIIGLENFKLPKISFSEKDMAQLNMPERLRLGNRLERFFAYIIQQSELYELVAENIQVFEDKQTIGELDFILYDKQQEKHIHIELGGKLYLYDPYKKEELARWIGPNRRDSLLKKTAKLQEKQFPLLYNDASKMIFDLLQIDIKSIAQQVCLKARMFVPKPLFYNKFKYVEASNIKGYYINLVDFTISDYGDYDFFLPEKQDWIVAPNYGEVWLSYAEIFQLISDSLQNKMSPLIWLKKSETEFETFFVTWW